MTDPRFLWLDALIALALGHALYKGGETAGAYLLRGVPSVVLVFEDLVRHGWITDASGQGRLFTLTQAGRRALWQGAEWYQALPLWRRLIRPRFALPAAIRRVEREGDGTHRGW